MSRLHCWPMRTPNLAPQKWHNRRPIYLVPFFANIVLYHVPVNLFTDFWNVQAIHKILWNTTNFCIKSSCTYPLTGIQYILSNFFLLTWVFIVEVGTLIYHNHKCLQDIGLPTWFVFFQSQLSRVWPII